MENKSQELKILRNEREQEDKNKKSTKRYVEIRELEDGTYALIGFAWELILQKDEIQDAFGSWLDKSLEKGKEIDLKKL